MKKILATGLLAVGLLMGSLSSSASAATYTDQATFLAANPGLDLVSFEGQATGIGPALGPATTFGGLDFTGTNLHFVDTSFWGSVDSLLDDTFNGFISASFGSSSAIGFFYATNFGDGTPVSFTAFNGAVSVFSQNLIGGGVNSNFLYFGVDGVGPITSITLDAAGTGGFSSIGEISLGAASSVPEPATTSMLIVGVGLLGAAARRRRDARQ